MEVAANLLIIGIVFLALAAGLPLAVFLRQTRREARDQQLELPADVRISSRVAPPAS